MKQTKTYQVTYSVYPNEKIKQVSFHGQLLYPLYIQLIYNRKNTVYKSGLFDLFLKPKYDIRVSGQVYAPPIKEVIAREERLVEFIINKHANDFSFEIFKKEYDFYSKDLLEEMEPDFLFYLHTFFHDEGMPELADVIRAGGQTCMLAEMVKDMKRALKPDLYGRLVEHSFYYAPPYLALYDFAQQLTKRRLVSLLMMDWENPEIKEQFSEFMAKYYPTQKLADANPTIDQYVKRLGSRD
jgi:hypothetical protein